MTVYCSTRGQVPAVDFATALLTGLASDGGLYIPLERPQLSDERMAELARLDYRSLAVELLLPYVGDLLSRDALAGMVNSAYAEFAVPEVVSIEPLGNLHLLELFHGPTCSFKDIALQLCGRLLHLVLSQRQQRMVVLGATSGDTGSAAIEACRENSHLEVFILFPRGRVSDIQRHQMTTVDSPRVHCIAIDGDFDDCQQLVKEIFLHQQFLPTDCRLGAVNSINWGRIMAQIVYYFYAALRVGGLQRPVRFVVPTGNFGNAYAGYTAHRMGLPMAPLLLATNCNDILHRALQLNDYSRVAVQPTLAPSMDISVASNFERQLYDICGGDSDRVRALFSEFAATGRCQMTKAEWLRARSQMQSQAVDDEQMCACMEAVWQETGQLLDPHTAIAVQAALKTPSEATTLVLATAHPAKFPEAANKAGVPAAELPMPLVGLCDRQEHYSEMPVDRVQLSEFIREQL